MSAEPRRLWWVRRVDGGVVPPAVGLAKLRTLVQHWPRLTLRIARVSASAMSGDDAQMAQRGERLVQLRALQLALLGDALHGVYSLLREASPASVADVLADLPSLGDDEPPAPPILPAERAEAVGPARLTHAHDESIELSADALLRERAAYEEVRECREPAARIKLLHAHTMRQALLVDALCAQMDAALADPAHSRRMAMVVAVRA